MIALLITVIVSTLNTAAVPMQAPATTPAASVTPAPGAEASPAALNASDLDALKANVGKEIEVTGTPTNSGHSKAGNVLYLNFGERHKAVTLVFFVKSGEAAAGADAGAAKKAQTEDDLKPFIGKSVSVKGKLTDYKGDLQIAVNSLDQIKVAPTP